MNDIKTSNNPSNKETKNLKKYVKQAIKEKEARELLESKGTLGSNQKAKRHMNMSLKNNITNSFIYVLLILISIIWLTPFVLLVLESFGASLNKETGALSAAPSGNPFSPDVWTFNNYRVLFTETNFPRWFLNTFLVALVVAVLQTLFVLSMSYCLSRLRFNGRKFLMNLMLVLGMFPGFLTLILLYKLFADCGLTEAKSPIALVIVYVASSGMGYYVSKGFFDTISKSLDEAARVDGATRFQIFYKIIMPLSKPIIIYTVLTAFMGPWGDFMFAKYLAHGNQDGMNVAAGLQWLISSPGNISTYYKVFCAGGVVVAIPITILFMCLQKYYVEGVTGGAVKG